MDELAYALKMDPIALRLKNYAEKDPESGKPWSSKSLRECYQVGAGKFGWDKRTAAPGSMKTPRRQAARLGHGDGDLSGPPQRVIGPGPPSARRHAYVQAGTQDLGTGTYTVMTQTAADALGLPPEQVRFELGDTLMPETPVSGGSQTAASTGSAVQAAGLAAKAQAIALAVADTASPLSGLAAADIDVQDGRLFSKADPDKGRDLRRPDRPAEAAQASKRKPKSKPGAEKDEYAMHSFGAVFAEVQVDPDLGEIRVTRIVGAYGVGQYPERQDRPQPAHRRHRLRHRHGPAGRNRSRPALGPGDERRPGRVPRPGQRRRPRH